MTLKVLAIDTSTEGCSVALLWHTGEVRLRFEVIERGHGDRVLPMTDELLREAGCRLEDLDGIAFGRGPGGFTGLRIAAGVTQGLAFGAGLPVAPVSSLAAVAFLTSPTAVGEVARSAGEGSARSAGERAGPSPQPSPAKAGEGVLVCNDARMNEVYWGAYRFDPGAPCLPVVLAPETVSGHDRVEVVSGVTVFAGNGLPAYPPLQARLEAAGLRHVPGLYPRADAVARLGEQVLRAGHGLDAASAVPMYVRDDVVKAPPGGVTKLS
jgi:tRNA threonylcarbamoyladenosine biosynthesis protein TsaB